MYKETALRNGIVRKTDGMFIPLDPSNLDYQEYLKWVAAGNTPESVPEHPELG